MTTTLQSALNLAAHLASIGNEKYIVTLSAETCIADLIYCIRTNPKKLAKRMKRLEFCLKCFPNIPDVLKQSALMTIAEYSPKINNTDDGFDAEYFQILHNIEEFLRTDTDTNVPFFLESDPDPANVLFNDELKKSINHDGYVYSVFAKVAVIALSLMKINVKNNIDMNADLQKIIQDVKIVFKGGAAMGHFLFQGSHIWDTLSNKDKDYVISSFIKGGDNDTSLVFSDDVDDTIRGLVLQLYMRFVNQVVLTFDIQNLIQDYIQSAEQMTIKCFGDEYFVCAENRRSYEIVDYIDGIKTLKYDSNKPKSCLYSTHSKCSFDTKDGRSDFFLSRIKIAFQVYSEDSIAKWNKKISCNAECLDVSVATSKDVRPFVSTYTCVLLK
jgi:hypothetical protein